MSHTYNYQTVSSTILADLYTPVGVYLSLRGLYPQSALMESSVTTATIQPARL